MELEEHPIQRLDILLVKFYNLQFQKEQAEEKKFKLIKEHILNQSKERINRFIFTRKIFNCILTNERNKV